MADMVHVVCPHCSALNRAAKEKLTPGVKGKCGQCGDALFEGLPIALNEPLFDRHSTKGDLPLLVDFWAAWCGPCQMMAPNFEAAAPMLEPLVRLGKVDTEAEQSLAARFNIRSIPTLGLFRHGKEIARNAGLMDEAAIARWTKKQL